jgi:hypothetical protein
MEKLLDIVEKVLSKSDPVLSVAVLVIAIWLWKLTKVMIKHLDPQQAALPHPQCIAHQTSMVNMEKSLSSIETTINVVDGRIDNALAYMIVRGEHEDKKT